MHEKILIIQTAFLGDAILTLPLIQYLKRDSNSQIDVLCIPSTAEIFGASPFVDTIIEFDKRGKQKSFLSFIRFVNKLKENNYSKVISPHRSFRSSLIIALMGIKNSIGFDKASMSFVYKKKIKHNWSDHEVLRNLKLADYCEDDWKIKPIIESSDKIKLKISEIINENNLKNFIIIAPGSVWYTKAYPIKSFSEAANELIKSGFTLVLIGGKSEYELCNKLNGMINNNEKTINLAGELSIIESIELMRFSKLVICNDSAPTHMGMSADIPVLTLYCSTIPGFGFYPYNNQSKYLSYDELKCKPCGIHGKIKCPLNTFECAEKIAPKKIVQTALKMIS